MLKVQSRERERELISKFDKEISDEGTLASTRALSVPGMIHTRTHALRVGKWRL